MAHSSAEEKPSVRLTISLIGSFSWGIVLSLLVSISSRSFSVGGGKTSIRSNLPGRFRAGSIESILFVEAITMILLSLLNPSISVNSCSTSRVSCWDESEVRAGAIASISSIKIIAPPAD